MSEISLHGGDPSVLRRLNAAATLRALRGGGEPTLSELARLVGLSRPTTEGVIGELTGRGLVAEVAPRSGSGLGRPARRYRFRAEAGYALGLDIDAHSVQIFLADLNGQVIGSHRAGLDVGWEPPERLAAVRAAIKTCLSATGIDRSALWAVAAGTPGVVTAEGTVAFCTVVPGWQGLNLGRELGRSFACPVYVENDANLATMAERWRGVAEDTDDVICVLAGLHTGVGAVIGGRLHRGRWGAAGEIGMLPELGLRDTTAALTGVPTGSVRGAEDAAAEAVLTAAQHDDPEAVALVERLAARMSRGIAAMALAIDPEMIVVGGALTRAGDRLIDELRRQVRPLCLSPLRIEASTLGDEAVGVGAVRLALDRIDENLFRVD
ncbi:ROK family protein [Actinomadura sp. 9N407]|uniref:ROK family transcriptional regulator n=1 Tax=Actinomadura sp. 9N407 TaxID=3375154 RepID=UPI003792BD29